MSHTVAPLVAWLQRGFHTVLQKPSWWPICLHPASLSPIVSHLAGAVGQGTRSTHQLVLCVPSFYLSCSWSPAQQQRVPRPVPRPLELSHQQQLGQ